MRCTFGCTNVRNTYLGVEAVRNELTKVDLFIVQLAARTYSSRCLSHEWGKDVTDVTLGVF